MHQRHELKMKSVQSPRKLRVCSEPVQPVGWESLVACFKIREVRKCNCTCAVGVPLISVGIQFKSVQQTFIKHLLKIQLLVRHMEPCGAYIVLWRLSMKYSIYHMPFTMLSAKGAQGTRQL